MVNMCLVNNPSTSPALGQCQSAHLWITFQAPEQNPFGHEEDPGLPNPRWPMDTAPVVMVKDGW